MALVHLEHVTKRFRADRPPATDGLGSRVRVMIRPDDVIFVPDAASEAVIRGSENLYCLDLPSGHRVHSSRPSSAAFPNGLRVRPEAHVLHVVTFPATS